MAFRSALTIWPVRVPVRVDVEGSTTSWEGCYSLVLGILILKVGKGLEGCM